jgi:hypothetical protein
MKCPHCQEPIPDDTDECPNCFVDEPQEDDYLTEDFIRWFQYSKHILTTHEDNYKEELLTHMRKNHLFSSVWWISDHGNYHRIDLTNGDTMSDLYKLVNHINDNRKLRLFAVACCRRIAHLITDPKCQNVVETAELFADGLTDQITLVKIHKIAYDSTSWCCEYGSAASVAHYATFAAANTDASSAAIFAASSASAAAETKEIEIKYQISLLINLTHPYTLHTTFPPQITQFANLIYLSKEFHLLPVLADMLEDNYFTEPLLLQHLRSTDTIYKGWWSLDVVRNPL